MVENDLDLLTLLPVPIESWDYRNPLPVPDLHDASLCVC